MIVENRDDYIRYRFKRTNEYDQIRYGQIFGKPKPGKRSFRKKEKTDFKNG